MLAHHAVEILNRESDDRLGNRPVDPDDLRNDLRPLNLSSMQLSMLHDQLGPAVELRLVGLRDHVVLAIKLADHDVDCTVEFHLLSPSSHPIIKYRTFSKKCQPDLERF